VFPSARPLHAGTYVCAANGTNADGEAAFERAEPSALSVTGLVPKFTQTPVSFVRMPTLPDANLQFDVEISFRPQAANGKNISGH